MIRNAIRVLLPAVAVSLFGSTPALAQPGTVIVKYRSGVSSAQRGSVARRAGARRTVGTVRAQGARVMSVSGDPVAVARRLASSDQVVFAEANRRVRATRTPNDRLYRQLGGLAEIHAAAGWSALGLGSFPAAGGAPVGVVDTGIDTGHEDLAGKVKACAGAVNGRIKTGACVDDNDHGTHVAGTIAATPNNRVGVLGVAFNSPLIVCKALDAAGSGKLADVASCIAWAHEQGARVISMSLGGPASVSIRTAVRAAWSRGGAHGSVVVAAAGNDGNTATDFPAGYPEVVSVAAVDDAGRHASFSNANADVEIAAPGVQVLSTHRGGGYVRFSGTSMATPHVAGAAALLWGAHPRSTAASIRKQLDGSVTDSGPAGRDPSFGWGVLDLARVP
ncbi:MAG: S8 family serine peptidase [Solirubrobacteraceae bacterium]